MSVEILNVKLKGDFIAILPTCRRAGDFHLERHSRERRMNGIGFVVDDELPFVAVDGPHPVLD